MKVPRLFLRSAVLCLCVLLFSIDSNRAQQPGDTTIIQAFEFGEPQNDWFAFPPLSESYERILMHYTLKCVPGGAGGLQYPCGEWDYTTRTWLYDHTGDLDSNLLQQNNYVVNNSSPDSFQISNTPSWIYNTHWEYQTVYTDTTSLVNGTFGVGALGDSNVLATEFSDSRSQYFWSNTELTAAGFAAGDFTGLGIQVLTGLSDFSLTIKMLEVDSTNIQSGSFLENGTVVYDASLDVSSGAGWYYLPFTSSFTWDGLTNIGVEFCVDQNDPGQNTIVAADDLGYSAGITAGGNDGFLEFDGADYVAVPNGALASVDSQITITVWQYGDPNIQPQSDYIFEGRNAANQRVVNVHLPWSDSRVYWDAGNDGGSYDRIDNAANAGQFEGQWNHWAFVKDATTGTMQIFLNGVLWRSGTGKTRAMTGITQFKVGSNYNGTNSYDGMLNEFQVWKTALDATTINDWMYKDVDAAHPAYSDLLLYYKFDEGQGSLTTDHSTNNQDGVLLGMPQWMNLQNCENIRNFTSTNIRPQITLQQGVFTSHLDSTLIIDSVMDAQTSVVLYSNSSDPTAPTDTLFVYQPFWGNYVYDVNGNAIDSTWYGADSTIYLAQHPYYSDPFEVIVNYELGRYITPYGIGLDLGDGWTWVFDVSDYRPLLHDSVHLAAGNWQELLDMKFLFIHGTPPRTPMKVENIWTGTYGLSNFNTNIDDRDINLDANTHMWRLKTRASGHRFSNPTNCAEFCPRQHWVDVNNNTIHTWLLWKECADNALYPQGGTWLNDRAAWCPGAKVTTYDHELTPYISGNTVNLDYSIQQDPYGEYVFQTHAF